MRTQPLPMSGTMEECLLFHFSVPAEIVRPLVPSPLELMTYHGYGFWSVTAARLRRLRPWPLPRFLGITYWQIAYRLLVLFDAPGGERIRGTYTVRSDLASYVATPLGKLFSNGRCHHARVSCQLHEGRANLRVSGTSRGQADAEAVVDISQRVAELPPGSRFLDFASAQEVLDCAPAHLTYDAVRREVNLVRLQGDDSQWKSQPVRVLEGRWNFLADPRCGGDAIRAEPTFWVGPMYCLWPRREVYRLELAPVIPAPVSALPLRLGIREQGFGIRD